MEQIQSSKANPLKTKLLFELQSSLLSGEYVDQIDLFLILKIGLVKANPSEDELWPSAPASGPVPPRLPQS